MIERRTSLLRTYWCVLCVLFLALACVQPAGAQVLAPGNYCVSCHPAGDPALSMVAEWQAADADAASASVTAAEATCPGVKAYREQLLYTEQLLAATERAGAEAGARATASQANRLAAFREGYEALRQAPVTSLDAFTSQAQQVRFQGNKVYAAFHAAIDTARQNWVLLFAALVTLVVLGSLAWGLRNTLVAASSKPHWLKSWRPGWRTAAVTGLVFLLFALPLFRVPTAAVEMPTVEQQAVQTALDTSDRVADTADRALARAWMLARVGAAWAQLDPDQGRVALDAALTAARDTQGYADALWGQAQAAQEAAIGSIASQDDAVLLAERLASMRARAWGLRLIAAEWVAVDGARAAEIMAEAQALAERNPTAYGLVDLAAIAVDWTRIDPGQAAGAAAGVTDAALRSRAEGMIARAGTSPPAPYVLRTDRVLPPGAGVASARELLLTLESEADKAEVLRFIAASTGAQEDFDAALSMALAGRVRGDPLAPAEASLALAKAMLPVDEAMARAAFAQAFDISQKIAVTYK